MIFVVIKGRSYFLLLQPTHKRMKIDEINEIHASLKEYEYNNNQLSDQINNLIEKLNEFKHQHLENLKYKEAEMKLIKDNVINPDLTQRITF